MARRKSKFKPKPGQVDFTNIRYAPVINCVLKYEDKFLVVKRSDELNWYPGFWTGVSGFLDDKKSFKEKICEEIREEVGISRSKIKSINLGAIFLQDQPKYKKTWIVHPVLVEVSTEKVKLDFENQDFKWVSLSEIRKLKLLPGFDEVLKRVAESRLPKNILSCMLKLL